MTYPLILEAAEAVTAEMEYSYRRIVENAAAYLVVMLENDLPQAVRVRAGTGAPGEWSRWHEWKNKGDFFTLLMAGDRVFDTLLPEGVEEAEFAATPS